MFGKGQFPMAPDPIDALFRPSGLGTGALGARTTGAVNNELACLMGGRSGLGGGLHNAYSAQQNYTLHVPRTGACAYCGATGTGRCDSCGAPR